MYAFVIGDFLICEIFTEGREIPNFSLENIPKNIGEPFASEQFNLIGVVAYRGNGLRLRVSDKSLGHYTAIALRQNQWYEYDDMTIKEKRVAQKLKIAPTLLIFSKK